MAAQNLKEGHQVAGSRTKYVVHSVTNESLLTLFFSFLQFCNWPSAYCDLAANMWTIYMKADDQLRKWFEDDDALERAIDGE